MKIKIKYLLLGVPAIFLVACEPRKEGLATYVCKQDGRTVTIKATEDTNINVVTIYNLKPENCRED